MQLQNVILLMGPPGSGKGTQSKLLVSKLGYSYFSMGDTLREYAAAMDTSLGRTIKNTIDQGFIVPDEIAKQIFEEKFASLLNNRGSILDGYPRTLGQVQVLAGLLEKHHVPFKVFFLDVDKQKLLARLSLRSHSQGRADDVDVAAVEKRFDEYITKTAPVKEYYESQGLITHINGDQSIEAVHQEIMSKLGLK